MKKFKDIATNVAMNMMTALWIIILILLPFTIASGLMIWLFRMWGIN